MSVHDYLPYYVFLLDLIGHRSASTSWMNGLITFLDVLGNGNLDSLQIAMWFGDT